MADAQARRKMLEGEWQFGHPPISINLIGLDGSVGAQLQAIARLMPPFLPALNVRGASPAARPAVSAPRRIRRASDDGREIGAVASPKVAGITAS